MGHRGNRPGAGRYDAFVSYSRRDSEFTAGLQADLLRLAKPWFRRHRMRVFRDQTDLAAEPDLWEAVSIALDRSDHLIVVASAAADQSPWVVREIEHFRARRPAEKVAVVELGGGGASLDNVRRAIDGTPGVWARVDDDAALADRSTLVKVAGLLLAMGPDQVIRADRRERRRTRRHLGAALVVVALLAGATVVGAREASRQADEAAHRERLARSQVLAALAAQQADAHPEIAVRLAVTAWKTAPTVAATQAVLSSGDWSRRAERTLLGHGEAVNHVIWQREHRRAVASRLDGSLTSWEPDSGHEKRLVPVSPGHKVLALTELDDGPIRALADDGTVREYDERTLEPGRPRAGRTTLEAADVGRDGSVVVLDEEGTLRRTGPTGRTTARPLGSVLASTRRLALSPDGRAVAVIGAVPGPSATPRLLVVDLDTMKVRFQVDPTTSTTDPLVGVTWSGDGTTIGTIDLAGDYRGHDAATGKVVGASDPRVSALGGRAIVPIQDQGFLLLSIDRNAVLVDRRGEGRESVETWHTGGPTIAYHDRTSGELVTGGYDGSLERPSYDRARFVTAWPKPVPAGTRVGSSDSPAAVPTVRDGSVSLADARRGKGAMRVVGALKGRRVLAAAVADQRLGAVTEDGRVLVVNLRDETVATVPGKVDVSAGAAVAWAGKDLVVASVADGSLAAGRTGRALRPLKGPRGGGERTVWSVAGSQTGAVAAAYADGTVAVWTKVDARPHQRRFEPADRPSVVAFAPDGHMLVTGDGLGVVGRWRVPDLRRSGEPIAVGHGPIADVGLTPQGWIAAVTPNHLNLIHPTGRVLLSDLQSTFEVSRLIGGMAVAGTGTAWRSWEPSVRQALAYACAAAPAKVAADAWPAAAGDPGHDPCEGRR